MPAQRQRQEDRAPLAKVYAIPTYLRKRRLRLYATLGRVALLMLRVVEDTLGALEVACTQALPHRDSLRQGNHKSVVLQRTVVIHLLRHRHIGKISIVTTGDSSCIFME